MEDYWAYIGHHRLKKYKDIPLDWDDPIHINYIELAASASWGLGKGELTMEQFIRAVTGETKPKYTPTPRVDPPRLAGTVPVTGLERKKGGIGQRNLER